MRIRIGDLLVKAGVITELQLKAALAEQQQWGGKLGDILVRMEFLTEEVLVRALSKQTGIARADLTGDADQRALGVVPADTAEEFCLVPISLKDQGRTVVVALHDLSLAARFCHRIVLMQAGRAVAAGAPEDVLAREHLASVYGIEARYVLVEGVPVVLPLEVLP